MPKQYLTLHEKWKIDMEIMEEPGYKETASSPICDKCKFDIKEQVFHCKQYVEERKPIYVLATEKECPKFYSANQLDIKVKNEVQEKIYGAFFGFILGDIIGLPVELSTRAEREKDPVKELRAYGTYHQPYGFWSDDTSLTLCLAECISKGFSIEQLANLFIKFYQDGYQTPGKEVFNIEIFTKEAIEKMISGIPLVECGGKDEQSNGNGSLMRILPLVFFLQNENTKRKIEVITEVASLTHRHNRSILACIIYVQFGIYLCMGMNKKDALYETIAFVEKNCKDDFHEEIYAYQRVLSRDIGGLKEEEIKSTGYVVDTLEASLWSFITTANYKDAILKAINLGGDTDTIGAITGSLAGMYYGHKGIPHQWIQYIEKKEEILQIIDEFICKL